MIKKTILFLFVCGGILYKTYSQATVSSLLQWKDSTHTLVQSSEKWVDRKPQQVFSDYALVCSFAFSAIESQLNKPNRKLNKTEQELYETLKQLHHLGKEAIRLESAESLTELQTAIEKINCYPFKGKNPQVKKIVSPLITQHTLDSQWVVLKGNNLKKHTMYASINRLHSVRTEIISNDEIRFLIPIIQDSLTWGMSNRLEFVILKGKKEKQVFSVPLWVYPEQMARISLHYTYMQDRIIRNNYAENKFMSTTRSCAWTHNSSEIKAKNAAPWQIDVNSVSVNELDQAPGGGECYIESKSPTLIRTKVTARSNCGGIRYANPEQGTTVCRYTWSEFVNVPSQESGEYTFSIKLNDSLALRQFPHTLHALKGVSFTFYNGTRLETTELSSDFGFLKYEFNTTENTFFIQSRFE